MTLIASVQSRTEIMTLSDIMVSRPLRSVGNPIVLPLAGLDFFKSTQPFDTIHNDYAPSGAAQKCVLLGNNFMALWAGSAFTAKIILKKLLNSSKSRVDVDGINVLAAQLGLNQADIDGVSLMLFRDTGNHIQQDTINTEHLKRFSTNIIYAGSGSFPVIMDIQEALFDDEKLSRVLLLNRLSAAILGEILTQENGSFNFGGWFELTEFVGGSFSKIPYVVKLWYVEGDRVVEGPGLLSGYRAYDLLLFRLDARATSADPPFQVRDFLARGSINDPDWFIPDEHHKFELHVVQFGDLKKAYFVVLGEEELSISVSISRSGLSWSSDPAFVERLFDDVRAGRPIGQPLHFSSKPKD